MGPVFSTLVKRVLAMIYFETIQWGHHDKTQLFHVLCLCWCIHCDRLLGLHVSCFGCASCWTISCVRIWGWVTVNSIYGIVLVLVFSQIWNQWSNYDHFWSILINSDQFWSNHCFDQNRSELIRIDQNWSEFNICLKHVYSTLLSVIHHLIDVSSVMNCSTCVQFLSAFTVKLDMLMALAKGMCTSSIVFHTIQID